MRSTASGKDSVLFGRKFFLCGGDAFRSAGRGCPLRRTFAFYIYFIFNKRDHPPGGLPKTSGHGILQLLLWKSSIGCGGQPDKQQPEDCCLQEGRQRFFFSGGGR